MTPGRNRVPAPHATVVYIAVTNATVVHTSKRCPMVRTYPNDYARVPASFIAANAARCTRNGACSNR